MKNTTRVKYKDNRVAYTFLAPTIIIFITLVAVPLLASLLLSFTKWNFLSGLKGIKILGLNNYKQLLRDTYFISAIKNTFVYTITTVPLSILISLILAHILNGKIYMKKILRLAFMIPYFCSAVAVAVVFKMLFREDGPINMILLNWFHVQDLPKWFADSSINKIPIIFFVIWSSIGFGLIIYTAALQGISQSLYEAADIDGATSWKKFINITVPLISPTTFYLVIVRLIAVFKIFTSINVMTYSQVTKANTSIVSRIYEEAFFNYNFGYASAEAMVLFLMIMGVTLVNFVGQKKWVHY